MKKGKHMTNIDKIQQVTNETFLSSIATGVVLVDFFAVWCAPCKMLATVLKEVVDEVGERASFIKVDIDDSQEVAENCKITSVPTLILFKDGVEVDRLVGLRDKEELVKSIYAAAS